MMDFKFEEELRSADELLESLRAREVKILLQSLKCVCIKSCFKANIIRFS